MRPRHREKGIVMNNVLLKWLSAAGVCLLVMSTGPQSFADGTCPTCPSPGCPTCPQPSCPSCPGYCRTGCGHECCLKPVAKWALCCNYYVCPPDYGWNAPVKVPVVRRGVTYYRYWPEHWYGTSSPAPGEYRSYPQVYSPTDTTQFGYTYQQVPYWQPAPYRLPPPPVPSQFHVREAHHGYSGRWHSSYTPIHHHQPANLQYWVEPIGQQGQRPMPQVIPQTMPIQPPRPMVCPPAPEPMPTPKVLVPEPATPAATEPAAPVPPADEKSAAKAKPRLSAMMARLRRSGD